MRLDQGSGQGVWRPLGPFAILGVAAIAIVTGVAWFARLSLYKFFHSRPELLPSVSVALVVLVSLTSSLLWVEDAALRRRWRRRAVRLTGVKELVPPSLFRRLIGTIPDPLEWLASPLFRTRLGSSLKDDWEEAGLGRKASRYLVLLGLTAFLGGFLGQRVAGSLLALILAACLPIFPWRLVRGRADAHRRLFGEQLPTALDSLASGQAAGLSFAQSVDYAQQELPQPASSILAKLSRRVSLGHPVDQALKRLAEEVPEESLGLVVEGIVLQRQFGGDLVRMLEETGELLRDRVELEREVRAVTTQGRLSGSVIAALVPVSAGILLAFNPSYIDVLFDNLIGQAILVVVIFLQLAGWAIISRLMRIRY